VVLTACSSWKTKTVYRQPVAAAAVVVVVVELDSLAFVAVVAVRRSPTGVVPSVGAWA